MRVMILLALLLFVSSSANAQTRKGLDQSIKDLPPIRRLFFEVERNRLHLGMLVDVFDKFIDSNDVKENVNDPKLIAVKDVLNGLVECNLQLKWSRYFIMSYAEGARRAPCEALVDTQNLLKASIEYSKSMRTIYRSRLGDSLNVTLDSALTLVDNTWLYIHDNIPDSCSSYTMERKR